MRLVALGLLRPGANWDDRRVRALGRHGPDGGGRPRRSPGRARLAPRTYLLVQIASAVVVVTAVLIFGGRIG